MHRTCKTLLMNITPMYVHFIIIIFKPQPYLVCSSWTFNVRNLSKSISDHSLCTDETLHISVCFHRWCRCSTLQRNVVLDTLHLFIFLIVILDTMMSYSDVHRYSLSQHNHLHNLPLSVWQPAGKHLNVKSKNLTEQFNSVRRFGGGFFLCIDLCIVSLHL